MSSEEASWPVPMKAIGAQNLLTMPGGVTKSGYLHKKGGTQFQLLKWPLRFVIIHNGCVYYFKTSTSASPQGAFSLKGYNRVMRAAEETTSNNVFPFKLVHVSKKYRTWFFSAASEDERKDWMASLRKEIDDYHEKKETVTDFSDSGSDVDSFYGSVERPINISYSLHSTENSDYDQDEDDEYLQPDNSDCGKCDDHIVLPPRHSPPPVPPTRRPSSSEVAVQPFSGRCGVAVLPALPPLKKHLTSARPQGVLSTTEFPSDYQGENNMRSYSTSHQRPVVPLVPQVKRPTCSAFPVGLPLACVSPTVEDCKKLKELKLSASAPPPVPSSKPKPPRDALNPDSFKAPRKPDQPGHLALKVQPKPQPPSDKTPAPGSKLEKPLPLHLDSVSLRRSAPDGQSFRAISLENPALPSTLKSDEDSLDDDYEKVELPDSVFVDTSESIEVERLFKVQNPSGQPKNGLFCIRNSSTQSGKVLVVWDASMKKLRNYRIFQKDLKFYLEADVLFLSLGSLIEHYSNHILPSHNNLILRYPYGYSGPR